MKKENIHILSSTSYADGTPILEAQDFEEWKKYNKAKQGAYCSYINKENKKEHILYNWYVLNGEHPIIPNGMRLANTDDWRSIELELENDEILHSLLMKGQREIFGYFQGKGKTGRFWSNITSERNQDKSVFYDIFHDITEVFTAECDKRLGHSILCIKE